MTKLMDPNSTMARYNGERTIHFFRKTWGASSFQWDSIQMFQEGSFALSHHLVLILMNTPNSYAHIAAKVSVMPALLAVFMLSIAWHAVKILALLPVRLVRREAVIPGLPLRSYVVLKGVKGPAIMVVVELCGESFAVEHLDRLPLWGYPAEVDERFVSPQTYRTGEEIAEELERWLAQRRGRSRDWVKDLHSWW